MTITAKMVQELRERSGAPMMDCKRALEASGGDLEAAIDHLRKSGLKSADKRAGRETAQGLVGMFLGSGARSGAMVAVSCETDFVARNENFTNLVTALALHVEALRPASVEELLGQTLKTTRATVSEAVKELAGKLGENMRIAQIAHFEAPNGRVGGYVHHDQKKGALVAVGSTAPEAQAAPFLSSLGKHIVAFQPVALSRESVPAEVVERERAIYRESEEVLAKPEDKRERIVAGKLEKFLAGSVLLEQPWVHDPNVIVTTALRSALGENAAILGFERFQVGA